MSTFIEKLRQKVWCEHRREVILYAVLFFVVSLSFGLGYLADRELNGTPIIIEKGAATQQPSVPAPQ